MDESENTGGKQNPALFKPGQSGNPAGRPKGARNKLGEHFVQDLYADWQSHGIETLARVREEKPADYVKVVASLLPKEVKIDNAPLSEMSDDELSRLIDVVRAAIGPAPAIGEGEGAPDRRKPAPDVPTLQ